MSKAAESNNSTDSEVEKAIITLQEFYPEPESIVEKKWEDMKILVVDDHPTGRRIVIRVLLDMDVKQRNITEGIHGKDAVDKLKAVKYDFIVSDWHMPRLTGLDLLKIVKTVPGLRHIPFLMITVESEKDRILQAIQGGVDNYIIKPFTSNVLDKKIKSTLFDAINKNTE